MLCLAQNKNKKIKVSHKGKSSLPAFSACCLFENLNINLVSAQVDQVKYNSQKYCTLIVDITALKDFCPSCFIPAKRKLPFKMRFMKKAVHLVFPVTLHPFFSSDLFLCKHNTDQQRMPHLTLVLLRAFNL